LPKKSDEREASVRPFWSGTISFGLVSIPVNLFPATRESRVSLRMLGPDGEPLKREYVGGESGKELGEADTTRGFETESGKVVTVSNEELDRLAPEKSRTIDLRLFVPANEISPLYYDRAYFLTPGDKSAKAYRLLAEVMERKKRVGVATFVMRGKEHLVAILAEGGILRAQTLRFADEVRSSTAIGLPKKAKAPAAMVRKFETAIKRSAKKTLDLQELRDDYADATLKLIEQKRKKHKDVVESEAAPRQKPAQVVDLMEVLKSSLGQSKKSKSVA
jgi:DNA end-binding protein Ku